MNKEKAIEICKNLTQTISKMVDRVKYQSQSSAYKSPSASKHELLRIKKNLMKKYNLK